MAKTSRKVSFTAVTHNPKCAFLPSLRSSTTEKGKLTREAKQRGQTLTAYMRALISQAREANGIFGKRA